VAPQRLLIPVNRQAAKASQAAAKPAAAARKIGRMGLTMTHRICTIHAMPTNNFRRQAMAAGAGAVLFSLGLREAVRLRDADLDLARNRARQLGATRILVGVVLLVRPQLLTAALGLSGTGKAGWWLARMLAVREIAVGTGTVAASRPAADPWPWLMTVSAIDGAEGLVLFAAVRRKAVDRLGGRAFIAADAGSAAALFTRIAGIRHGRPTVRVTAVGSRKSNGAGT
jgi:hypothetical protein